jgi:beta-glucosidase
MSGMEGSSVMAEIFKQGGDKDTSDAVDYYQFCTSIPIATLVAQSWDIRALSADSAK